MKRIKGLSRVKDVVMLVITMMRMAIWSVTATSASSKSAMDVDWTVIIAAASSCVRRVVISMTVLRMIRMTHHRKEKRDDITLLRKLHRVVVSD